MMQLESQWSEKKTHTQKKTACISIQQLLHFMLPLTSDEIFLCTSQRNLFVYLASGQEWCSVKGLNAQMADYYLTKYCNIIV